MFGYKIIKEKKLNKIKHNEDYYFHRCQEAEDKNFELEEDNENLYKYVNKLYDDIFENFHFPCFRENYKLSVNVKEDKVYDLKTLCIDLKPIQSRLDVDILLNLSDVIDEHMLDHFSKRISEEFFNNIKKELLRNFGYEY